MGKGILKSRLNDRKECDYHFNYRIICWTKINGLFKKCLSPQFSEPVIRYHKTLFVKTDVNQPLII